MRQPWMSKTFRLLALTGQGRKTEASLSHLMYSSTFLILPGKLSLHSRNFKKSQFLVTEKEQKKKPVIGVWHERWKTSNVPIPAAPIKHSENGRKLTNDRGMLNNSAAVPGVLQIKFLRTTLINLQFFYCKTGSLIPSQIFLSSYKSAVISRPTCSRSTAI